MLLGNILKNMNIDKTVYCIENEQNFETMGILDSKTNQTMCSFLDDKKYTENIPPNVSMLLTTEAIKKELLEKQLYSKGILITASPRLLFFEIHNFLSDQQGYTRKRGKSEIDETAVISPHAYIEANNVIIGKFVVIEPFVTIYENTVIKDNVIIRSGARIGGQGFEFKRTSDGIMPVEHKGGVIIEEYAEIQNNTCIDRAVYPWDNTIIGSHTKIDNLVHIGHAVKVASNVMIVANSGIGGRTEIKDNVWIGFGATLRNGIVIEQNARANMGSVVTKNVPMGESVTGNFAVPHEQFIKQLKKSSQ